MEKKPIVLLILDGFGISKDLKGNAVRLAKTPVLDKIFKNSPYTQLKASGEHVGLPAGQMGNSEVGHMNIGAGRVVYQDLTYINNQIKSGEFKKNEVILNAFKHVLEHNSTLHLAGLLSDGGIHSSINHLYAILNLALEHKVKNVNIHVWTDGRDTPTHSGIKYVAELEEFLKKCNVGEIKTITGRFYSMDRDKRWERTNAAYEAITRGVGEKFSDLNMKIRSEYENGRSDEFIKPAVKKGYEGIHPNDVVICFNFRPDRARQITEMFLKDKIKYVCLCQYDEKFECEVAFKQNKITNTLGEWLAKNNLVQLRVAETEKYAHVTFFLNAREELAFENEHRIIVNSPKVKTYDLTPQMSAEEVTDKVIKGIQSNKYDIIFVNYANPDMLGHTGNLNSTIQSIEKVDDCVGKVINCLKKHSGIAIITADHGNAEKMLCENEEPCTSHTCNEVPFAIWNYECKLKDSGALCDIAPTILSILNIKKPAEMTGKTLII